MRIAAPPWGLDCQGACAGCMQVAAHDPALGMLNILITIAGRYFGQQER